MMNRQTETAKSNFIRQLIVLLIKTKRPKFFWYINCIVVSYVRSLSQGEKLKVSWFHRCDIPCALVTIDLYHYSVDNGSYILDRSDAFSS